MKTLVSHYQKVKEKLNSRLQARNSIEEVVKIVLDEINKLTDLNGEYIKELTPAQARLARDMLEAMKRNFLILTSVELREQIVDIPETSFDISEVQAGLNKKILSPLTTVIQTQRNIQSWTSFNYYKQIILQPLQQSRVIVSSLLAAGVVGTLDGGLEWGLVGAIIGLITGGVFIKVFKQREISSNTERNSEVQPIASQFKISIDIDKLLSYLYQNFQSIDQTIYAYGSKSETSPKTGLENNLELLEYLQELMADALDEQIKLPITVRRRIEQAITILRRNGIEAHVYQPSLSPDQAWEMFYFEPSLDPSITEYVTLKHAFVKDQQVLLPGSVIEPASSN